MHFLQLDSLECFSRLCLKIVKIINAALIQLQRWITYPKRSYRRRCRELSWRQRGIWRNRSSCLGWWSPWSCLLSVTQLWRSYAGAAKEVTTVNRFLKGSHAKYAPSECWSRRHNYCKHLTRKTLPPRLCNLWGRFSASPCQTLRWRWIRARRWRETEGMWLDFPSLDRSYKFTWKHCHK